MLDILRTWILAVGGTALFCSVALELAPKGAAGKTVKSVCALAMALALISPLIEPDMEEYSLNLAQYRQEAEAISGQGEEIFRSLSRTVIEEQCRAYILDKAQSMGCPVSDVSVSLKWSSEGCWYPEACRLEGEYNAGLSAALEGGLGIAAEKQEWGEGT